MLSIDRPIATEVLEVIRARVRSETPITLESSLTRDLALDSLAAMDLVLELETRFDITIPLSEMPDTDTVGALVDLIDRARLAPQKA